MTHKPHMPKSEDRTLAFADGTSLPFKQEQRLVCTCGEWTSPWAEMSPLGLTAVTAEWRSHVTWAERKASP